METAMKSMYFAIALLVAVQTGFGQDAPPAAQKPATPDARQRSASEDPASAEARRNADAVRRDEERAKQAMDQANQAVRRAAQKQQALTTPPDGITLDPYSASLAGAKLQMSAWLGLIASHPPPTVRRQLKTPAPTCQ